MHFAGTRVSVYKLHPFEGVADNTASESTALVIGGNDIKMIRDSATPRRYVPCTLCVMHAYLHRVDDSAFIALAAMCE